MTSIRALLETHTPIPAVLSTEHEGYVLVENPDFREIIELAGVRALPSSKVHAVTDTHTEVETKYFLSIVKEAHNAVHPGPSELTPTENYQDEPDVKDTNTFADEAVSRDERRDSELSQLRGAAMHYAVQIVIADIQAAHGLDVDPRDDLVELAEKINGFLKG
jgi:hypothetical protein